MEQRDACFIPSSYSRIVARELRLTERDLDKLLWGTELPRDVLLPGDETRMTGRQQLQILDNAQRVVDLPDFGLRLGRQLQPASHGPLGYLALSSPDLLTSLESLRDFLPVRLPLVSLALTRDKDWLRCSLNIRLEANANQRRIVQESFAMVIQSQAEAVLGREVQNGRVLLAHPRPDYHRRYAEFLHSPVAFQCEETAFLIPATLAGAPNTAGDPQAFRMAEALCRKLLAEVPRSALSTADRVRHLLLSGQPGNVTELEVARAMYVSRRTLSRRLDSEGTSFRAIRERLLSELAARHLRESRLTIEAVALLLGYGDSAAFRKAFRRWFHQTPGEFRRTSVGKSGADDPGPVHAT